MKVAVYRNSYGQILFYDDMSQDIKCIGTLDLDINPTMTTKSVDAFVSITSVGVSIENVLPVNARRVKITYEVPE